MVQGTITRSSFPISDFINDARTVIDQMPRLLASLEYIAGEDKTSVGGFDFVCMITTARQVINSMQMVSFRRDDALGGKYYEISIHA